MRDRNHGLNSDSRLLELNVGAVRFEHRDSAIGVGTSRPRLSWTVATTATNWYQTAYRLQLNDSETFTAESPDQVSVAWPFKPLTSRGTATVRVKVASGRAWSEWSEPSTVEAGLLHEEDWVGRFISARTTGAIGDPAPVFKRTFILKTGITGGRLYMTAHGVYLTRVNGRLVDHAVLAPGWTSYHHRLHYQTYDLGPHLRPGENSVEIAVGNGWYRGRLGPSGWRALYGDRLAVLAQIEVRYRDGTLEKIGTDGSWFATRSEIIGNDLYDGEITDLRVVDDSVDTVDILDQDLGNLEADDRPPVRPLEIRRAIGAWSPSTTKTIVDFGQNIVGWVRLRLRNVTAGEKITVRHAEVLRGNELDTRSLHGARATDVYMLHKADEIELHPRFTVHGFRYAEVSGITEDRVEQVDGVVVGTDLRRIGWFTCSDPLVKRLHENIVWSARGNFLSIPTDCPQRDERFGWTGDIQLFAHSACFLFDTERFLWSWLADLAADQYPDGSVPYVVPDLFNSGNPEVEAYTAALGLARDDPRVGPTAAGWGDAATVIPWVLYEHFGDLDLLSSHFASMRAWVDRTASLVKEGVWSTGFQYGDWLNPITSTDQGAAPETAEGEIATAYLARSAQIVASAARALQNDELSQHYTSLAMDVRDAFVRDYVTNSGRIVSDSATVYAMALQWDLLPDTSRRDGAARRLADLVRANGFRMNVGFLGTPLILHALTSTGRARLAYRLLLEKGCPSWLYPVTQGATTMWESWQTVRPDGTVDPQYRSFNHFSLGSVADWMHRTVGGLGPAEPGYRKIHVHPVPHQALDHASAWHLTPYGEASVSWRRTNARLTVDVTLPPGTSAQVCLPGRDSTTVGNGNHHWTVEDPCSVPSAPVSTIRDLIDCAELWDRVVSMLVAHELGDDSASIARQAGDSLDAPVGNLPYILARKRRGGNGRAAEKSLNEMLSKRPAR